MSSWHRENPELAGTDADPWMANPGHRRAYEDLVRAGVIYNGPCEECDGRGVIDPPDRFGNYDPCDVCEGTGRRL